LVISHAGLSEDVRCGAITTAPPEDRVASDRTVSSHLLNLVPLPPPPSPGRTTPDTTAEGCKELDALLSLTSEVAESAEIFGMSWWMTLKLSNSGSLECSDVSEKPCLLYIRGSDGLRSDWVKGMWRIWRKSNDCGQSGLRKEDGTNEASRQSHQQQPKPY